MFVMPKHKHLMNSWLTIICPFNALGLIIDMIHLRLMVLLSTSTCCQCVLRYKFTWVFSFPFSTFSMCGLFRLVTIARNSSEYFPLRDDNMGSDRGVEKLDLLPLQSGCRLLFLWWANGGFAMNFYSEPSALRKIQKVFMMGVCFSKPMNQPHLLSICMGIDSTVYGCEATAC